MATPIARGPDYGRVDYRRVDRVVTQDFSIAFRVMAAIAAAVLLVFGLIGLARISWDDGLDSAAVDVADVTFTPIVAIAAAVTGLLALLAAATSERTSKLVMGALLVSAGIVAFIARPDTDRVILEDAHGWLMVVVGGVMVLAALGMSWAASRRVVDTDTVYDEV